MAPSSQTQHDFRRALYLAQRAYFREEPGRVVARLLSDETDRIVISLFNEALGPEGRAGGGLALIAVGGYGRRQLAPYSDLDLLLLHDGWGAGDIEHFARSLTYPLWNAGRDLGFRVRTPKQALQAVDDLREGMAALDGRFLVGDQALWDQTMATVRSSLARSPARVLARLADANSERHATAGSAGRLLEPHLRDSAGALRDIQALAWAAALICGRPGLEALNAAGHLDELDCERVDEAAELLMRTRIGLHFASGRRQDRLYLADVDALAVSLGYRRLGSLEEGDVLMRELHRRARTVEAVSNSTWDSMLRAMPSRSRAGTPARRSATPPAARSLDPGTLPHPRQDPAAWLGPFVASAQIGSAPGRSWSNHLHMFLDGAAPLPWTPGTRDALIQILAAGSKATPALEALDESGLLVALIPEWAPIRCCPQRNPYHQYAVDTHSFATVAAIVDSLGIDEPHLDQAWDDAGSDPLGPAPGATLLLAALLHDIGKGRGPAHAELGADLALTAASRMGLSRERLEDIAFLVRDHLTLAETATHRDLTDERTAAGLAQRVGSGRRLAMLFLLTRADAVATGPEAWSPVRASLIQELYGKASHILHRGSSLGIETSQAAADAQVALASFSGRTTGEIRALIEPLGQEWLLAFDAPVAARQLDLMTEPLSRDEVRSSVHRGRHSDELLVVAWDKPGLFATVSGVLAVRGINVLSARIFTRADGIALEVFRVSSAFEPGADGRWNSIPNDIASAVRGHLDVEGALRTKAAKGPRPALSPSNVKVAIDNSVSDFSTVVEVRAPDRLGLLHVITKTLTDAGCDVNLAKVATYGTRVVDAFYVRDLNGERIEDPHVVRHLQEMLIRAVSS